MNSTRLQNGFGQVSTDIIRDPSISATEKAVYAYLCCYADKHTHETFVSVNKIATENNISVSTVKRALEKLMKKNVIIRNRRGKNESWITKLLK